MTMRSPGLGRLAGVLMPAIMLFAAMPAAARDCTPDRPGWDDPVLHMQVERIGRAQVLLVEGRIGPDLPRQMEAMLVRYPDVGEIRFHSSGGDMASAMEAGRRIRSHGVFVTHVPAGWGCAGACALLFLSGNVRSVDPDGVFDIGRFYANGGEEPSARAAARQSFDVVDYLIRMGVSRRLLANALDREAAAARANTPPRLCLTSDELRRYNVANWSG